MQLTPFIVHSVLKQTAYGESPEHCRKAKNTVGVWSKVILYDNKDIFDMGRGATFLPA